MLTRFQAIVGICLVAWPTGAVVGSRPPATARAVSAVRLPEEPADLLALSDEELRERIEVDPACLGSLSIGSPGSAVLVNGVKLATDPRWTAAPGAQTYGTTETMAAIETAIETVHELFPDSPALFIGDISSANGGRLKRHDSHQGGRDVDFGFYYKPGKGTWYTPGSSTNLDMPRNWALVRALVTRADVEVIFLDTRIQRLLYRYALSISEDKAWLDSVFQFAKGSPGATIRHLTGHRTHYHVRFYNPVAQELGRRAHPLLVQAGLIDPPVFTVRHVVRRGETMGGLAARYRTSVRAIKQANGLKTTLLRAGRAYRIPMRGAAPPVERLVVPFRKLPPETPEAMASVSWPTMQSLYGELLNQVAVRAAAASPVGLPLQLFFAVASRPN
jgi:murein endopeptidase